MPIDRKEIVKRKIKGSPSPDAHAYFRKDDGRQVCGSRVRKKPKNVRCARPRGLSPVNGRCRGHGGFGSGAPIKSGLYSNVKMGPLGDSYQKHLESKGLSSADDHLALSAGFVQMLLEMADKGDGLDFREQAVTLCETYANGMAKATSETTAKRLEELRAWLKTGRTTMATYREAITQSDKRQVHVLKAADLQIKSDLKLSESGVTHMLGQMVAAVMRLAPEEVANAIIESFREEIARVSPGAGQPPG